MSPSPKASIVALTLLALAACSKAGAPVVDTAAAMTPPAAAAAPASAADKEAFKKDITAATKAGIANNAGTSDEIGVSGDLAWEWNTYSAADKSGKVVEKGKYVTVFERRNGKWVIIRDIWNSDG